MQQKRKFCPPRGILLAQADLRKRQAAALKTRLRHFKLWHAGHGVRWNQAFYLETALYTPRSLTDWWLQEAAIKTARQRWLKVSRVLLRRGGICQGSAEEDSTGEILADRGLAKSHSLLPQGLIEKIKAVPVRLEDVKHTRLRQYDDEARNREMERLCTMRAFDPRRRRY